MTATKIKRKPVNLEQPLETDRSSITGGAASIGKGVIDSFWKDVLKGTAHDIPSQFYASEKGSDKPQTKKHGDLISGQEFSLKKQEITVLHRQQHNETYFGDVKNLEKKAEREQDRVMEQRVEEIRSEIKKLIAATREMQIQFKDIAKETTHVSTKTKKGKYDLHFFDWVLSMLRNARMKMQEGNTWTKMFASKKRQKSYWNMFKKHGTSFGLSGERTTATQTG